MELFFDTETSGFRSKKLAADDPNQAWIVQLAAILSTEEQIMAEINVIIKAEGRTIHPMAQQTHGISVEAAAKGMEESDAAFFFLSLVAPATVVICHNHPFDAPFVNDLMIRSGFEPESRIISELPNYCTMRQSTDLCKLPGRYGKFKWPKLTELHQFLFNEDFEGAHDALADVRATRRCYYELKKRGL